LIFSVLGLLFLFAYHIFKAKTKPKPDMRIKWVIFIEEELEIRNYFYKTDREKKSIDISI